MLLSEPVFPNTLWELDKGSNKMISKFALFTLISIIAFSSLHAIDELDLKAKSLEEEIKNKVAATCTNIEARRLKAMSKTPDPALSKVRIWEEDRLNEKGEVFKLTITNRVWSLAFQSSLDKFGTLYIPESNEP